MIERHIEEARQQWCDYVGAIIRMMMGAQGAATAAINEGAAADAAAGGMIRSRGGGGSSRPPLGKPYPIVHCQVARLRKEDRQLIQDITEALQESPCDSSIYSPSSPSPSSPSSSTSSSSSSSASSSSSSSSSSSYHVRPHRGCNVAMLRQPRLHHSAGELHVSSPHSPSSPASASSCSNSNNSTPRASTPSPLGVRARSWSADAWDAAISSSSISSVTSANPPNPSSNTSLLSRTLSSSF